MSHLESDDHNQDPTLDVDFEKTNMPIRKKFKRIIDDADPATSKVKFVNYEHGYTIRGIYFVPKNSVHVAKNE